MPFRVLSWNINGLRSFKTEMKEFLSNLEADILCFQETKITRNMLDEQLAIIEGYSSYFGFSRKRSGYSGVATFCTENATPIHAQEGLSGLLGGDLVDKGGTIEALTGHWTEEELKDLDSEGRAVITQHAIKGDDDKMSMVAVINVYCPRVDPEKPERRVYKLRFYELLRQRAAAIHATGCHVVIVGDINTSHKRIDHCDPDESEDFEKRLERRYMDRFLIPLYKEKDITHSDGTDTMGEHPTGIDSDSSETKPSNDLKENAADADKSDEDGIYDYLLESLSDFQVVDTFRYFHPSRKEAFTCWNTFTNARSTNYGTRIDYIFCDEMFLPFVEDSEVLQEVMGSDHCPVSIRVKGSFSPSTKLPAICTKYFPEFKGNQQKLFSYFQSSSASEAKLKDQSLNNTATSEPKRKSKENGIKSLSSKRPCIEKQSKLSSYFTAKTKNMVHKPGDAIPDIDANLKENLSSSQSTGGDSCPSEDNMENLSQGSGTLEAKLIDDTSGCCITAQKNTSCLTEIPEKSSVPAKPSGWGFLMKGPKPPPLCPGHKEPTVLRTVKKKGPNMNKQFYACARGAGREGDPNAQCNFFQWLGKK